MRYYVMGVTGTGYQVDNNLFERVFIRQISNARTKVRIHIDDEMSCAGGDISPNSDVMATRPKTPSMRFK